MTDATGTALIVGSQGGLGSALQALLMRDQTHAQVMGLSRRSDPPLDYERESTLADAAQWLASACTSQPLRTVIVATGHLHTEGVGPERALSHLDADYLQRVMRVNAIGPTLLLKHLAPLLPREGLVRLVFISAKVGSIGDNQLGGWYGYRASKAALNQFVKTASIELARKHKTLACIALHPGTVDTALSQPFSKSGLNVRTPEIAAGEILSVVQALTPAHNGQFLDYQGKSLPW